MEYVDKKNEPFLYVIQNMDKVNIDERLKPTFIEVLKRMQVYFTDNDLLDVRNYGEFFDKYLLGDGDDKLKIEVLPYDIKNMGNDRVFNCYTKEDNKISILESEKYNPEDINTLNTLCHEFIHYMVRRTPYNGDKKTEQEKAENIEVFFDEGFTEKISEDITHFSGTTSFTSTYKENTDFTIFLQNLFGKRDSNMIFLQGYPLNEAFLKDDKNAKYCFAVAHFIDYFPNEKENKSDFFITGQRGLLQKYDTPECNSLEQFIELTKKLSSRPYDDNEFMNSYYRKIEIEFMNKIGVNPNEVLNTLEEIRHVVEDYHKYNCDEFYKFNLGEGSSSVVEVAIDKNGDILRDNESLIGSTKKENNTILYYTTKNISEIGRLNKKISLDEIDFTKEKTDYQEKLSKLISKYNSLVNRNMKGNENMGNLGQIQQLQNELNLKNKQYESLVAEKKIAISQKKEMERQAIIKQIQQVEQEIDIIEQKMDELRKNILQQKTQETQLTQQRQVEQVERIESSNTRQNIEDFQNLRRQVIESLERQRNADYEFNERVENIEHVEGTRRMM